MLTASNGGKWQNYKFRPWASVRWKQQNKKSISDDGFLSVRGARNYQFRIVIYA